MSEQQQALTIEQDIDLAVQHHKAGHLSQAESIYQQILQANPDQVDALHSSGVIAHQAGNHDLAVDRITKALALKPDYADAHNGIGLVTRYIPLRQADWRGVPPDSHRLGHAQSRFTLVRLGGHRGTPAIRS